MALRTEETSDELNRGRGGSVRLRIGAIEALDEALDFLDRVEREGRLSPDAVWGAPRN